jgi:Domain of unknown function (DUF4136)
VKIRTCWALIVVTVLLTGTAWTSVTTDYDHHANFSDYKTYSWGQLDTGNSLWDQRVKNAVDGQLATKGWTQLPSEGDVVVNAFGKTRREQNVHGSWSGFDSHLWGPFGDATPTRDTYHVGTLVVEMSDATSNNLIWRGVLSGTLSSKPDKDTNKLDNGVREMFKHFPPDSGG